VLLFADESECLTHPYLAYVWARRGEDRRLPTPGQAQRRALLGALDMARRELIVVTSAPKRRREFIALLEQLDRLDGPTPRRPARSVVLGLDHGPSHTSKATPKARAMRPWLTVEGLPKYTPEFNAIEPCWQDLKGHFLAHQTFASAETLDAAIHQAVAQRNQERQTQTCSDLRKAA
jgi:transposase